MKKQIQTIWRWMMVGICLVLIVSTYHGMIIREDGAKIMYVDAEYIRFELLLAGK